MLGYFTSLTFLNRDDSCVDSDLFLVSWFPYVVIVVWLVLVSQWLVRLNAGLERFDPISFLPIIQGNFILWSIISGAICFQEFVEMKSASIATTPFYTWIGFIVGVIIMFSGLYLICSCPDDHASVITDDDPVEHDDDAKELPAKKLSPVEEESTSVATSVKFNITRAKEESAVKPPFWKVRGSRRLSLSKDSMSSSSSWSRSFMIGPAHLSEHKHQIKKERVHKHRVEKIKERNRAYTSGNMPTLEEFLGLEKYTARDKMIAFYSEHNPSKLSSVDALLEKYAGREDKLLRKLHETYATSSRGHTPPASTSTSTSISSSAAVREYSSLTKLFEIEMGPPQIGFKDDKALGSAEAGTTDPDVTADGGCPCS